MSGADGAACLRAPLGQKLNSRKGGEFRHLA
jgi:hypothetical protein